MSLASLERIRRFDPVEMPPLTVDGSAPKQPHVKVLSGMHRAESGSMGIGEYFCLNKARSPAAHPLRRITQIIPYYPYEHIWVDDFMEAPYTNNSRSFTASRMLENCAFNFLTALNKTYSDTADENLKSKIAGSILREVLAPSCAVVVDIHSFAPVIYPDGSKPESFLQMNANPTPEARIAAHALCSKLSIRNIVLATGAGNLSDVAPHAVLVELAGDVDAKIPKRTPQYKQRAELLRRRYHYKELLEALCDIQQSLDDGASIDAIDEKLPAQFWKFAGVCMDPKIIGQHKQLTDWVPDFSPVPQEFHGAVDYPNKEELATFGWFSTLGGDVVARAEMPPQFSSVFHEIAHIAN